MEEVEPRLSARTASLVRPPSRLRNLKSFVDLGFRKIPVGDLGFGPV